MLVQCWKDEMLAITSSVSPQASYQHHEMAATATILSTRRFATNLDGLVAFENILVNSTKLSNLSGNPCEELWTQTTLSAFCRVGPRVCARLPLTGLCVPSNIV